MQNIQACFTQNIKHKMHLKTLFILTTRIMDIILIFVIHLNTFCRQSMLSSCRYLLFKENCLAISLCLLVYPNHHKTEPMMSFSSYDHTVKVTNENHYASDSCDI